MNARGARVMTILLLACASGCGAPGDAEARRGEAAHERDVALLALAPLPDERHGHRAEVLGDGRVLVFGGFRRSDASAGRGMHESHVFDPRSAQWSRTGDLAVPLAFHGSAVHDGVVFAVGEACVQRFDVASNTWSVVARDERLPATHIAAAVAGGRLFALGFRSAVVDLATFEISALPEPPDHHDQDHFSYVVELGGALHVIGGFAGADFQPRTRHVVFDGERWSHAAPLPFDDAAKFGVGAVHAGRFFLFGMGGNAVYEPASDTWSALPPPPWSDFRCMPAAFVHGARLHLLGGLGADRVHGSDVFDLDERVWLAPDGSPLAAPAEPIPARAAPR